MAANMAPPKSSPPVRTSEKVGLLPDVAGPAQAKASLRSDRVGPAFATTVQNAVVRHYGSVKAAAISLGNVDPSLMQREFEAGKFGRLEQADEETKAFIAQALVDAYGPLKDPKARARQKVREAKTALDELEQFLDHIVF